jgi:NAD(P)-dependent dehydrogenase (short-subunit alcohol dehydrogenase family)
MDLQLSGLRALVTGGTRGIGRATVEAFVAEGVSVAFCARHSTRSRPRRTRCRPMVRPCWAPRSMSRTPRLSRPG